ncbi:thymidylate kinase, partial [Candidatus Parcubacteria bacterium]|nr:thymidylate kinase [Candidatus Parcubacteria bacterium]
QPTEVFAFPRYGQPACVLVEKYLHGEYGTATEVGPFAGSMFYAADRYDASFDIRKNLDAGANVICDRFTSSNMGHQAGKIDDLTERDAYLEWLDNLEFKLLNIPRPDKIVFLYVHPEISQKLMAERADKDYLKGKKKDIHEADMDHLMKASNAFLYVAKKYNWIVVDCAPEGELLSIDTIHEKVWEGVNA